jgi:hypothetical protein
MEVMVEREAMEDRQEPVVLEVRRVRLRQEVPVALFMLEDLSDTTLPPESSPVLGLQVR